MQLTKVRQRFQSSKVFLSVVIHGEGRIGTSSSSITEI
jgi:hypothetical protein